MGTWILISSAATIVAIVGCATIWRFDRSRAQEISRDRTRFEPRLPAAPTASGTHTLRPGAEVTLGAESGGLDVPQSAAWVRAHRDDAS
jgi:hypothetical protein